MNGARILIVDDEPQILRALQLKLRGAGYAVDTAATASEALLKASLRPPEAIILDVLLPDGRGTDVCREVRAWSAPRSSCCPLWARRRRRSPRWTRERTTTSPNHSVATSCSRGYARHSVVRARLTIPS